MITRLRALWADRKVLGILVKRDLRVRYSQSFLGYLWTIIDPLANALIYFMLFAVIFHRSDAGHSPYFLFLIVALLSWQWFNAAVAESPRALIAEQKLVRSTKLPRELWVIRMVTAKGIEFLLSLPVLIIFFTIYFIRGEAHLNWQIVFFPVAIVLQYLMCIGIGLVLAPITVLISDIMPLVRIFLRVFFYLCPIIFDIRFLEKPYIPHFIRWIYTYNPYSGVLELFRAGFFPQPVNPLPVVSAVAGTVIMLLIGGFVFSRMEKTVLKEI